MNFISMKLKMAKKTIRKKNMIYLHNRTLAQTVADLGFYYQLFPLKTFHSTICAILFYLLGLLASGW